MTDPELLPVKLYVSADQIVIDGDVAFVGLTFASAEDFSRKFLAALSPAGDDGAGGAS